MRRLQGGRGSVRWGVQGAGERGGAAVLGGLQDPERGGQERGSPSPAGGHRGAAAGAGQGTGTEEEGRKGPPPTLSPPTHLRGGCTYRCPHAPRARGAPGGRCGTGTARWPLEGARGAPPRHWSRSWRGWGGPTRPGLGGLRELGPPRRPPAAPATPRDWGPLRGTGRVRAASPRPWGHPRGSRPPRPPHLSRCAGGRTACGAGAGRSLRPVRHCPGSRGSCWSAGTRGAQLGGCGTPPPLVQDPLDLSAPRNLLSAPSLAQDPPPKIAQNPPGCSGPPTLLRALLAHSEPLTTARNSSACSELPPFPRDSQFAQDPSPPSPQLARNPLFCSVPSIFQDPRFPWTSQLAQGPPFCSPIPRGPPPHVAQVEGDLEGAPEAVGELGVHVQHLEQVLTQDLVQVAVGESPNVRPRLPGPGVQVQRLPEGVVLTWGCGGVTGGPAGPRTAPGTPAAAAAPKGALLIEANSGGYPEGREGSHQGCEQGWGDPREHLR